MASESARSAGQLIDSIRELSDVWGIDIASALEDYITDLEQIRFSFGGQLLDFTEAALFIQSSTCAYQKKVEHLYALVRSVLNPRSGPQPPPPGEDPDPTNPQPDLSPAPFTTLSHTLKEVDNLSLPAEAIGASRDTRAFTLASAPLSLMSVGQQTEDTGSESKMHSCSLHPSGALLLPHLHVQAHILASLPSPARGVPAGNTGLGPIADEPEIDEPEIDELEEAEEWWTAGPVAGAPDDPEAPMLVDPAPVAMNPQSPMPMHGSPTPPPDPQTPTQDPPTPADRARSPEPRQAPAPPAPPAPAFDPWKPLDPHEASGASLRPFRRGRTYSTPRTATNVPVADNPEEGQETAVEEGDKENEEDENDTGCTGKGGASCADVVRQLGLVMDESAPASGSAALRAPLWSQFELLHSAASKRRAAARKIQRKALESGPTQASRIDDPPENPDQLYNEEEQGQQQQEEEQQQEEQQQQEEDEQQQEHMQEGDDFPVEPPTPALRNEDASESSEKVDFFELEDDGPLSDEDEEDYALHRRVAQWQAWVEPMLKEQSCRTWYDEKAYEKRLIESFDEEKRSIARPKRSKSEGGATTSLPLDEVACTEDHHEISRFFLAALQLTNDKEVELSTTGSVETGDLVLTVNLLSPNSQAALEHWKARVEGGRPVVTG